MSEKKVNPKTSQMMDDIKTLSSEETELLILKIISNDGPGLSELLEKESFFKDYLDLNVVEYSKEIRKQFKEGFCEIPIMMAIVYGALESLKVIIQNVANKFVIDCDGNNILHKLVEASAIDHEKEDVYVEMYQYLKVTLSIDELKSLLHMEERHKLRPFELSFKLGVYKVCNEILETDGVYKECVMSKGVFQTHRYTFVDDYGIGEKRFSKSPLQYLRYLPVKHLDTLKSSGLMKKDAYKIWINYIRRKYLPLLIFWVLFRLALPMMSIYFFMIYSTIPVKYYLEVFLIGTPYFGINPRLWAGMIILTFALVILDTIELIIYCFGLCFRRRTYFGKSPGSLVTSNGIYRIMYYLSNLFALLNLIFLPFGIILQTVTIPIYTSIWSFCYFLEMIPVLSMFLYGLRYSMYNCLPFLIVYSVQLLGNAFLFWPQFCPFYEVPGQLLNVTECDFASQMYNMFLLSINMSPTPSLALNSSDSGTVLIYHGIFAFSVIFTLLNYLIAIISNGFNGIVENKDLIYQIQRLDTYMKLVEYTFLPRFILRRIKVKCCKKVEILVTSRKLPTENERPKKFKRPGSNKALSILI